MDESQVQQALESARDTELERARAIWLRKFGAAPSNQTEKARQMRFLQSRGFSHEVIRAVMSAK